MPWMTWLGDALRAGGLPVREIPGWQTRGHGAMADVLGVLCHHTAGPATGDGIWRQERVRGYPSLGIVVDGRADLAGPLANLGLTRDGTWLVIAAGQAWHAGTGSIGWCPTNTGNSHLVGVEAESVGTRDDWTDAQRASYPHGVAALLRYLNLPASRAIAHKEWAPLRKIDPAFWDMNAFRRGVDGWIRSQPPSPTPAPSPTPPDVQPLPDLEDDLMGAFRINPDDAGRFHEAQGAEAGGGSQVASRGWVVFGSTYGGTVWTVAALAADGTVLAYWPNERTPNNQNTVKDLPDGTRCVTVEGQVDNAGTRPWASSYGIR